MGAGDDSQFALLTINCLGVPLWPGNTTARLAALGREISALDLDVVCVQEVQLWRYLPILRAALPDFPHAAYAPRLNAPKGGLVTLSRWPIEAQRFTAFGARGPMVSPALADRLLHKGALVIELAARGMPVAVANTHLLANYDADWSSQNRYARVQDAQLRDLAGWLAAVAPERLLVVAGDFNVPAACEPYAGFVRATGLLDLRAGDQASTFRPPRYWPARFARDLDHVLARPPPGCRLAASTRLCFAEPLALGNGRTDHLSDHAAIEARIAVSAGSKNGSEGDAEGPGSGDRVAGIG